MENETQVGESKKPDAPKAKDKPAAVAKAEKKSILRNTLGKEVPESDYFYKGIVPSGFVGTCGKPVDREDLLEVFNKVFKPTDNILFYKQLDKEVYLVIVPIRYSVSVGSSNDSIDGDFQKHAISFLNEGSVNLDTLRQKLERVVKFVNYRDR
jgi:GR25 family glycosyltransferase involved in LPS biosynthesis